MILAVNNTISMKLNGKIGWSGVGTPLTPL